MKTAVLLIASCFFLLFVLTTFVPFPGAIQEAHAAGFDSSDIANGLQLTFERRFFFWGATLLELGLLCFLALTGWSRRWADRFLAWPHLGRIYAVLAIGLVYLALHEVLFVPLGVARWYHARAWGMSNLDLADWFRERYLAYGINLIGEVIVVVGFYALLILLPRVWWLIAPLGLSALGIAYAFLAPIWINPLFNTFTPLEETQWRHQQPRVQDLIDKAKVPVQEILVMNASRQSNHTNAYFTGFGPTRRIVLYDTLLKNHTDAEIESILGHELGHWQLDHINKGILLGTLAALLGCFVLDRCLLAAIGRAPWHLHSIADPAGLPLVMLLIFLGSWITMPVTNAVTRYFERQADTASLELAGQTEAFIAAELKLAKVNKSNVAPAPWNVWLFSSHPPTVERIRMAREWKP
ncbi:MAG: M48 family peptidase [Gemmataceae bacterium]|nr:M48 family peptidase [Gemmataceae bacterium]